MGCVQHGCDAAPLVAAASRPRFGPGSGGACKPEPQTGRYFPLRYTMLLCAVIGYGVVGVEEAAVEVEQPFGAGAL